MSALMMMMLVMIRLGPPGTYSVFRRTYRRVHSWAVRYTAAL